MSRFLRLALFFFVAAAMASGAHAERRIALVIGNAAYTAVSPLANPKNDADLMAKTLQSVGFEVTKITDADQRAMKQAMLDFGRKLRAGVDASLFYYSGHGVQAHGENYLIPVDASIKDEGELDLQTVDVNAFLNVMEGSASKVNIVILDACRNNPFASSFRSASRGLTMLNAPSGTYIAYSTGIDQVAEDGSGRNSPYTQALAEAIVKPGVKLEDTFKDARRIVKAETDDKQVPWESTSITGDFYFVPEAAKPAEPPVNPPATAAAKPVTAPAIATPTAEAEPALPPAPPPAPPAETRPVAAPPAQTAGDEAAWQEIASSTDATDFDRFLKAFPTSRFAAAAKARQAAFSAPRQLAALPSAGVDAATADGILVFLGRWPTLPGALDRFHAAQQRFPQLLGDKQPNIKAVTLATGKTFYRVRVGPFADVAQATAFCGNLRRVGGTCLVSKNGIVAASAEADPVASPVVHSKGQLKVPQTYLFDLDAGSVTTGGADVWFEAMTANDIYLVPRNGAALAPGDRSKRDFEACSAESYSTNPVSFRILPVGSYVCVKTSDGRIGSFRIEAMSPASPRTMLVNYVTWE